MELGTYADWASAIGSIGASVVALHLAGSDRRAAKEAQRPQVMCDVERASGAITGRLRFTVHNPSPKPWRLVAIEVLKPAGGRIIRADDCYERDAGGSLHRFAAEKLDTAPSRLDFDLNIAPGNSPLSGLNPDISILFKRPPNKFGDVSFKVTLISLEAVPDRFSEIVVRPMSSRSIADG